MIREIRGDLHQSIDGEVWFNMERTRNKPIIIKLEGGKVKNGKTH